jgi:hypothetical protein
MAADGAELVDRIIILSHSWNGEPPGLKFLTACEIIKDFMKEIIESKRITFERSMHGLLTVKRLDMATSQLSINMLKSFLEVTSLWQPFFFLYKKINILDFSKHSCIFNQL